jgi:hypothetical protein
VVLPPFHGTNFNCAAGAAACNTSTKGSLGSQKNETRKCLLEGVARVSSNIKLKSCYACNKSDVTAEAQICCSLQVATDDGVFMVFTHRSIAAAADACVAYAEGRGLDDHGLEVFNRSNQFWGKLLGSMGDLSILPEAFLERVCGTAEAAGSALGAIDFVELVHHHLGTMMSPKTSYLNFEVVYFKEYDPAQDRYLGISVAV